MSDGRFGAGQTRPTLKYTFALLTCLIERIWIYNGHRDMTPTPEAMDWLNESDWPGRPFVLTLGVEPVNEVSFAQGSLACWQGAGPMLGYSMRSDIKAQN
jgi:hypothetical protein